LTERGFPIRRFTVAKHEVFALRRRDKREVAAEAVSETAGEVEPVDALEAKRALRLLGELKPQQRLVLWLRAGRCRPGTRLPTALSSITALLGVCLVGERPLAHGGGT
jgi:hypothetical protein